MVIPISPNITKRDSNLKEKDISRRAFLGFNGAAPLDPAIDAPLAPRLLRIPKY